MAETDWKYLQYNVENGQKRTSDGPSGGPSSLSDLDDTNISNPSDGQMLGYDSTEGKWKNVAAPAGSVTDVTLDGNTVVNGQGIAVLTTPNVNELKDTNISSPSSGQTLQYNATTQKWENTTPSGGGGNVDDVKVNGTSVVTNKVANITSYKEVTQAQYEALPDTKLSDGVLYAIKDGGEGIEGYPPLIYSDEEREVGVWRDGKPLYQRTVVYGNVSNGSNTIALQTGLTNIDALFIVSSASKFSDAFPCPYVHYLNNPITGFFIEVNNGSPIIQIRSGDSSKDYLSNTIFTFRYTKTTDIPGSGTWTTQGALAHHYSTDEHIIGTWIDGKPLYEKAIALNSLVLNNWNNVAHEISNIDTLCRCEATYYRTTGVQTVPIPFYESASYYALCLADKTNISYFVNGYGSGKIIVILQYTKTTD